MIVFPENWKTIGKPVDLSKIENTILIVLKELNCNCLSLSGGIDSSLLLYYLSKIYGKNIYCYTIALSKNHPDFIYSKIVSEYFGVNWECNITPLKSIKNTDNSGNYIVKAFYDNLKKINVNKIISGDGIDEFMGGYYEHSKNPSEETYYKYINRLTKNHLNPLNINSKTVNVYLPFLDFRLILLYLQIPIKDKFDSLNRKKVIINLAKDKIPNEIISRRKYGFCDALKLKGELC